ncbi:MAG: DUF3568 family protein [Deltaproteobacteria bacterium]|nr:DUF3568 family protein [Deltaproteobacteria bacterium]
MDSRIKTFRRSIALTSFLLMAGCDTLPITVTALIPSVLSGAGGGVAYTITNTVYKTFSYPTEEVEEAKRRALEKMGIEVVERKHKKYRINISAETKRLKIYISLESITPVTTKIKVNAKRMGILKDKSTATELIEQTGRFIEAGDGE